MSEDQGHNGTETHAVSAKPNSSSAGQSEESHFDGTITECHTRGSNGTGDGNQNLPKGFLARLTPNEWLTLLVGVASLAVAFLGYLNARDTSDIKRAVSHLSDLADQTKQEASELHGQLAQIKRQADDADADAKTLEDQFRQMQDQTIALKDTARAGQGQLQEMRAEQRALIYFDHLEFRAQNKIKLPWSCCVWPLPGSMGKVVAVSAVFTNSGSTPTVDAQVNLACWLVDAGGKRIPGANDGPNNSEFYDIPAEKLTIGPRQSVETDMCAQINRTDLFDIAMGGVHLQIVGQVLYKDIFSKKWHVTRFARSVVVTKPRLG